MTSLPWLSFRHSSLYAEAKTGKSLLFARASGHIGFICSIE